MTITHYDHAKRACLYFLLFGLTVFAPTFIAAGIADNKSKSFCDDHPDLCNDAIADGPLDDDVRVNTYVVAGVYSTVLPCMGALIIAMLAASIPIMNATDQEFKQELSEETPILRTENENKNFFFEKIKTSYSNHSSYCHYSALALTILGFGVLSVCLTAYKTHYTFDQLNFLNATTSDQIQEVNNLGNNIVESMLATGLTLSALSCAVCSLVFFAKAMPNFMYDETTSHTDASTFEL